jgi:hypothetical protein
MNARIAERNESTSRAASRLPLVGLLLIQLLIGYEWFVSGLTKILRGGFPSGLAKELTEKSQGAPAWYRSFLDGSIIPHASAFGYLIEIGELLVGVALIAAALVWLTRWERLPDAGRVGVLATTVIASLVAIFMAVNFHLANGAPHPWLIPKSGFDEGVDLDSLLPAMQLVLIAVSVALWRSLRHGAGAERTSRWPHLHLRQKTERSLT